VKYKAVLFDWDDTLIDSIAARVKTLDRLFTTKGITQPTSERFWRDLQGVPLEQGLDKLAEEHQIQADLFEEFKILYWSKEQGLLRLYPGIREMLKSLRRQVVKLALVTNKEMKFESGGRVGGVGAELAEIGIKDWFSTTVGPEDVAALKPYPEPVLLALKLLQVNPAEAVMVGDSASDIKAAQAAGCHSCYATWGIPPDERSNLLISAAPDFIIDSPEDLIRLLK